MSSASIGGGGGGGVTTLPDSVMGGEAASHGVNTTTAIPPITYVDLGTVEVNVRAFDDTTEEFMQHSFRVPDDITALGTVTFEVQGWSATAASSKNVAFTFGHRAITASEAIDGAYTDEDADDEAVDANQDDLDIITWTETVANLGWVAGDLILYRFSRFAATTNNLVGDYNVLNFFIRIPRS